MMQGGFYQQYEEAIHICMIFLGKDLLVLLLWHCLVTSHMMAQYNSDILYWPSSLTLCGAFVQIVTSFKLLPKLAELDNKIWGQFSSWHKITPSVAQIKSYFHRKVLFSMFPWVKGLIVTKAGICQRRLVLTFSNTRTTVPCGFRLVLAPILAVCSCALAAAELWCWRW